jgi:hypothetical protein
MTKFNKTLFVKNGDYIHYEGKFVARFKYSKSPITKAKFLKELIANHSVESYFAEMTAGKAPLALLRDANEDWFYGILEAFSGRKLRRV